MLNPDFKEIMSAFNDADVENLIVGAYAVTAHGLPRTVGFGAPMECVSVDDFVAQDMIVQFSVPVSVIGRDHLLRNRRAVGRPHGLADADRPSQQPPPA
jgi:hypothetical protein